MASERKRQERINRIRQSLSQQQAGTDSPAEPAAGSAVAARSWMRWLSWPLLGTTVILVSAGLGFTATQRLLSPQQTNCSVVFWPLASASQRLYCAQEAAQQGTADGLRRAFSLVEPLPANHPLQSEIQQNYQRWAQQMLALAEEKFQAGKLERAITIARDMPDEANVDGIVTERIERWRSIWSRGEELIAQIERRVQQRQWNSAFDSAAQLAQIDNTYWSQTRYEQALESINTAREHSKKLAQAESQLEEGGVQNLLAAIRGARELVSDSYFHQEAQQLIARATDQLINEARYALKQYNWQQAAEIARALPEAADAQAQVADIKQLAEAGTDAARNTVSSLESAIDKAKQLGPDRPLHDRAQALIGRWQAAIEGVKILSQARETASEGGIDAWQAAISKADSVPQANPRYQQAQQAIQKWRRKIQIAQDRPILNKAQSVAQGGTVDAWQQAINIASQIEAGRPLYSQAQDKIGEWRYQIQLVRNRPILNRATSVAQGGNVGAWQRAIDIASDIGSGEALHQEAQANIRQWRAKIQRVKNRGRLNRAKRLANAGKYQQAINVAQQIGRGQPLHGQASARIQDWQQRLSAIRARQQRQQRQQRRQRRQQQQQQQRQQQQSSQGQSQQSQSEPRDMPEPPGPEPVRPSEIGSSP